jgi:predicted RNase H-like HicB family nuclease
MGGAPSVLEEATQVGDTTRERGLDRVLAWVALAAAALVSSTIAAALLSRARISPVRYTYDPESKNWCFEVPTLGIIGGAETRSEAERQAKEAIAYTKRFQDQGKAASV